MGRIQTNLTSPNAVTDPTLQAAIRGNAGLSQATVGAGNIVAFFGDSITNFGEGYPFYAELASSSKVLLYDCLSNPGYTASALLGVISQVTTLNPKPRYCVVLIGTNDAIAANTIAAFAASAKSIYATLLANGIQPVLVTIPPLTSQKNLAASYNDWIRFYGAANALPVIDIYSTVVDRTNGQYQSSYDNGDGIHPTSSGSFQIGQTVGAFLSTLIQNANPLQAISSYSAANLVANSDLTVDTNSDGLADQWSGTPTAGFTWSLVADAAGFKWQRITLSSAGGVKQIIGPVISYGAGTFQAGDRVLVAARVRSNQAGSNTGYKLQFTFTDSGYGNPYNVMMPVNVTNGATRQFSGICHRIVTVPAAPRTQAYLSFAVGPGDGTYDFSQFQCINLTKLGF